MITPPPSEAALIELFEGELTLADADIPWSYNTLTFVAQREDERIEIVIAPERLVQRGSYMVDF
jgi:hypothetical protein